MQRGVAGKAEAEAVGDGPGERDGGDGEEGRDTDLRVIPLDLAEAREHEASDEDQCGRGGEAGDGSDEWGDEERDEEEQPGDDGGHAGASARGYSGGGLDVAGDGAGSGERADDGGGGVGEEDAIEPGDGVVGGDESGALSDRDEGADVVKEIDEEEDEDDLEGANVESAANIELKGCGSDGGEAVVHRLPVDLVEEYSEEHGAEDADEHGGSDTENLQAGDEEQAEEGEGSMRGADVAEGDDGRGAGNDDAGVAESDEGDEEADASSYCGVELMRDSADEALTDAGVGQSEEDNTGEEDGAKSALPWEAHAFDDGIGEVGVEAHTGREGDGIVGKTAHEDAAEGCAEAGGGGDGSDGHSCLREDGGVHEDDVGHRDEGGEAGEDFGAPVSAVCGELEVAFEAFARRQRLGSLETRMRGIVYRIA